MADEQTLHRRCADADSGRVLAALPVGDRSARSGQGPPGARSPRPCARCSIIGSREPWTWRIQRDDARFGQSIGTRTRQLSRDDRAVGGPILRAGGLARCLRSLEPVKKLTTRAAGQRLAHVVGDNLLDIPFRKCSNGDERIDTDIAGDQGTIHDVEPRIFGESSVVVRCLTQNATAERVVSQLIPPRSARVRKGRSGRWCLPSC